MLYSLCVKLNINDVQTYTHRREKRFHRVSQCNAGVAATFLQIRYMH